MSSPIVADTSADKAARQIDTARVIVAHAIRQIDSASDAEVVLEHLLAADEILDGLSATRSTQITRRGIANLRKCYQNDTTVQMILDDLENRGDQVDLLCEALVIATQAVAL